MSYCVVDDQVYAEVTFTWAYEAESNPTLIVLRNGYVVFQGQMEAVEHQEVSESETEPENEGNYKLNLVSIFSSVYWETKPRVIVKLLWKKSIFRQFAHLTLIRAIWFKLMTNFSRF